MLGGIEQFRLYIAHKKRLFFSPHVWSLSYFSDCFHIGGTQRSLVWTITFGSQQIHTVLVNTEIQAWRSLLKGKRSGLWIGRPGLPLILCEALGKSFHRSRVLFSYLEGERVKSDPKKPSGGTLLTLVLLHLLWTARGLWEQMGPLGRMWDCRRNEGRVISAEGSAHWKHQDRKSAFYMHHLKSFMSIN